MISPAGFNISMSSFAQPVNFGGHGSGKSFGSSGSLASLGGGMDMEASMTFDMLSKDFNNEHGALARPSSAQKRERQEKRQSVESCVSENSISISGLGATDDPFSSSQHRRPLESCLEDNEDRSSSTTENDPPLCCDGGSISLSAFASGSLRFEDLSEDAFRKLDTPSYGKKNKSSDEDETASTSAVSSFYNDTMTARNESQLGLMAALDLSVSTELDLREAQEEREREERKKEDEARAALDRRVAFARTAEPMPSALRVSQRRLVPSSRQLERTKSVPRSMRVRWADEIKDIQKKRLSM